MSATPFSILCVLKTVLTRCHLFVARIHSLIGLPMRHLFNIHRVRTFQLHGLQSVQVPPRCLSTQLRQAPQLVRCLRPQSESLRAVRINPRRHHHCVCRSRRRIRYRRHLVIVPLAMALHSRSRGALLPCVPSPLSEPRLLVPQHLAHIFLSHPQRRCPPRILLRY